MKKIIEDEKVCFIFEYSSDESTNSNEVSTKIIY